MTDTSGVITTGNTPLAQSGNTSADIYEGDFERKKGRGSKAKGVDLLFEYAQSENIAEDLGPDRLARIGDKAVRDYRIDKESRREWEEQCEDAMTLAMQVVEEKSYPWPKASNIKFPLMTTAAIQFAARAYPAIITGKDIVKAKILGSDRGVPAAAPAPPPPGVAPGVPPGPGGGGLVNGGITSPPPGGPPPPPAPPGLAGPPGAPPAEQQWEIPPGVKRARGDRVSRHMSYQLTEEMEDWEEQTDKLLHIVPIVGCAFRKVWFDPYLDRNRSELVQAKDLVVNYAARSLETAPRITHEGPALALYPYEIVERERMGLWMHRELGRPVDHTDDEDAPHQFLEQHRYLDLDDDGYQEPYIVTVHKETRQVVRIVARYDAEAILQNAKGEVAKIDPVHYFIKYPFIPSPDGAFYDVGFGTLLNPINEGVNTTLNQMLDAGHLQNTGGGFIGRGLRLKGGPIRFRPGEWKPVDVQGGNVKENVVPLPFPGASQTLFQLLGLLIEAGRDITSVKDVMTGGEGPKNEAASRTLARIEQGMKVFTAIYKRLYRAWKKELKLLFELNARNLNPDTYFTFQDDPEAVGPDDYNSEDLDIIPVADPTVITDMQRMARGEFLMQFLDDPYFEAREIRERILASVSVDDIDLLLIKGEPPPAPGLLMDADNIDIEKKKLELERDKLDLEADKVLMEITRMESEVILNLAKAESEEAGPQLAMLQNYANVLRERVKADAQERIGHEREAARNAGQGSVSGVAGPSGNAGG